MITSRPSTAPTVGGLRVSSSTPHVRLQLLVGGLFLAAAAVVIIPALLIAERALRNRLEADRVAAHGTMMRSVVRGIETRVTAAEARTGRYARLLSEEPSAADPDLVGEFDRLVRRDPDGAWRSRRERFDAVREAGIFIPAFTVVDPHFKSFIVRAKRLTERFGAGVLDPELADAWVSPDAGGQVMFVPDQPDFVYEELPQQDYRGTEWISLAHPSENPSGVPRWTNPFHSVKTDAWFVSVVAPFTIGGRWSGSVGQDLSFAELVDYSAQTPLEAGGRFMIVGAQGGILFADSSTSGSPGRPEGQQLQNLPDREVRDTLARLLAGGVLNRRGTPELTRTSDAYLFSVAIPRTGWLVVSLIPKSSVVAPLTAPLRTARFAVLAGLGLLSVASLLAITREIRRRQHIEDSTRRAEERFRALFQLSPDGVALTHISDGRLIEVNDSFAGLTGYSRDELIGRTTVELGLWADLKDREAAFALLARTGICRNLPVRLQRKERDQLEVDFSARQLEIDGVPCLLSIIRDVEEQRRLELQLAHAQRMEAIGRLAGGVAHDFNNIMTGVMGYAQMALDSLPPESPVGDDLREILRASGRASELTRQLLAFARRQVTKPRPVDVNALVAETRGLLERLLGADVSLITELIEPVPLVLIDPGQLEQVLVNLVVNARDAMPKGGSLTLITGSRGDECMLDVVDTGVGIPLELHAHIFEPFYTTKEHGKGTGLGLSTCYGIVRQAGGRIELTSEPGKGSRFRVILPVSTLGAAAGAGSPDARQIGPVAPGGNETILLAEDEAQVRQLTVRNLTGLGYEVLVATNGAEALRVASAHHGRIELLVSDVVMPGMKGNELAAELRRLRPDVRVLYISGYAEDSASIERALVEGDAFLSKPFTLADLASQVRGVLDRRGEG